jgi:hypothetical protein
MGCGSGEPGGQAAVGVIDEVVANERVEPIRIAGQPGLGNGDQLAIPGGPCGGAVPVDQLAQGGVVPVDQLVDQVRFVDHHPTVAFRADDPLTKALTAPGLS